MYNKIFSQLSLLNVSSSSKSDGFKLKDINVLVGKEDQPWFEQGHVGSCLGISRMITSPTKLAKKDIKSRTFLQGEEGIHGIKQTPSLPSR